MPGRARKRAPQRICCCARDTERVQHPTCCRPRRWKSSSVLDADETQVLMPRAASAALMSAALLPSCMPRLTQSFGTVVARADQTVARGFWHHPPWDPPTHEATRIDYCIDSANVRKKLEAHLREGADGAQAPPAVPDGHSRNLRQTAPHQARQASQPLLRLDHPDVQSLLQGHAESRLHPSKTPV